MESEDCKMNCKGTDNVSLGYTITLHILFFLHCRSTKRYVVLENLTSNFSKPCIIDLKMGTRTHGDFATSEKKERQKMKCERSTSLR